MPKKSPELLIIQGFFYNKYFYPASTKRIGILN